MKTVTICASSRFADEVKKFTEELENLGVTVYAPTLYRASGGNWGKIQDFDKRFVASGLTYDHFQKIRMGDVVFILNKDGYSGNSVTLELGFAVALGKPVYALSDKDEEICRHILFQGFFDKAEDFVKVLK